MAEAACKAIKHLIALPSAGPPWSLTDDDRRQTENNTAPYTMAGQ